MGIKWSDEYSVSFMQALVFCTFSPQFFGKIYKLQEDQIKVEMEWSLNQLEVEKKTSE